MQYISKGFTLIELMIVVAIIGILASLAVSAYQTYTVRGQVSEGINLASGAKTPVVKAYSTNGVLPSDRAEAGLTPDPSDTRGSFVTQVDVVGGRIEVTFGNSAHQDLAARTLSLTPYVTSDNTVVWRCGHAPAPAGSELVEHLEPTVDSRYLPSACR